MIEKALKTGRQIDIGAGALVDIVIDQQTCDARIPHSEVLKAAAKILNYSNELTRRARFMTSDFDNASEILEKAEARFQTSLERFNNLHDEFRAKGKRAAGDVKDVSERIGQGIARIEKAADFDRLERYVTLLERAASAMKTLAEIQASGKLDKIAEAIR